ncbi:MAG TPA: FAD-dependent oxidoreductase [Kiritimatiellia bacterium]|nr:FAD-dependent oxidoreductase [Kiritimatiellia bacterium]
MSGSAPACVIVGGGHAGAQCALSLRQHHWNGDITVVGDEPLQPYHRPPLSKGYLKGETGPEQILIRPAALYAQKNISFRLGARVVEIDRIKRTVIFADGSTLAYDKLVLATGSLNRKPPIDGMDLPGVHVLRTAAESDALRRAVADASRILILGGGFIGLEVAASLRRQGRAVRVLEREPRILSRVTSPEMAAFLHGIHREEGVEIHTGVTVTAIRNGAGRLHVETKERAVYEADLVVAGTGAAPNTQLAEAAGLAIENGVRVDESCRTSDPDIYAIGDCACQHHPLYDRAIRLECVQNAVDQARTAAAALTGQPIPPRPLPWFWSDQYDIKLQMAGLSTGYDDMVLRRHPDTPRCLSAWYFQGDRLIAADAVNDAIAYAVASKLISGGKAADRSLIADPHADVKKLMGAPV